MSLRLTFSKNIKHDLGYYLGKETFCKYKIIDIKGDSYETEIHMPKDWTQDKFTEMIYKSFNLCDSTPKSVHTEELRLNLVNYN